MTDPSWERGEAPPDLRIGGVGWTLVLLRALPLAVLVFGGLVLLLLLRMIEAPIYGLRRPWTPFITQFVCRMAFVILGIGYSTQGERMHHPGAVVANHSSWLDIFALNARKRIYFVSKAEVAKWPGIGWLARATGTVFIRRERAEARAQTDLFQARLLAGHKLLFFPEGTSTDGRQVLPFKTTLFAAFMTPDLAPLLYIQPVSVIYHAPHGQDARFYGWWGDMDFAPHLLSTLAVFRQGRVELIYHSPVKVSDYSDRKRLAKDAEETVRDGVMMRLSLSK